MVIVDLRLADGSGLELIGTLSKAAPRVVTIVLTNHSAPAFREACALAGADYFFDRPSNSTPHAGHRIPGARSRAPPLTSRVTHVHSHPCAADVSIAPRPTIPLRAVTRADAAKHPAARCSVCAMRTIACRRT